jgi:hypothetical protein
LYRTARLVRNLEVLASGDPAKVLRRLINLLIGRRIVSHLWLRPRRRRRIGL